MRSKKKVVWNKTEGLPKDFLKRVDFIKSEIQTNRSSIAMISGIMDLLLPIYDEVESLIKQDTEESLKKADELFNQYMWGRRVRTLLGSNSVTTLPKCMMYDIKLIYGLTNS